MCFEEDVSKIFAVRINAPSARVNLNTINISITISFNSGSGGMREIKAGCMRLAEGNSIIRVHVMIVST